MAYFLHYAGTDFELPDDKAALELMRQIQSIQSGRIAGRLHVTLKDPGRVVFIFINPTTPVAISGSRDGLPETEPLSDVTEQVH